MSVSEMIILYIAREYPGVGPNDNNRDQIRVQGWKCLGPPRLHVDLCSGGGPAISESRILPLKMHI